MRRAIGGEPQGGGCVPHEQGDERHRDEEQTPCHDPPHGLPAERRDNRGEQGQKHQPPGGARGPQQPEGQAPLRAEPAIHHGGAQHQGGTPGPHADHHPPEEIEMEHGLDLRRGGHTGGNTEQTAQHHAPRADAQHQPPGERPGEAIEEDIDGDGERNRRAIPAEGDFERVDQHGRHRGDAGREHDGEAGHSENDPGIVGPG